MDVTSEQAQARVPVTIVRVKGDVDGSNYRELIERVSELHQAGARHLLLDLAGVSFMSSAGLVALHTIVKLFKQEPLPNLEDGWGALRALGQAAEAGPQPFVKLLSPVARVSGVLQQTGLLPFFQVHSDEAAALTSF